MHTYIYRLAELMLYLKQIHFVVIKKTEQQAQLRDEADRLGCLRSTDV